jgi:hypothetical protein
MAKKYPGKMLIVRRLYESPHRRAGRPDVAGSSAIAGTMGAAERAGDPEALPASDPDAADRARDRIAALREARGDF